MANEEHLRILLEEDVDRWNQWRADNYGTKPDLRNADLRNLFLIGADLHEAILTGSDLRGSLFHSANLKYSILSNAILFGSDLRGSKLIGSDLRWVDLQFAFLQGVDLRDADLSRANLARANLAEANLSQAKFCLSDLTYVHLARADLSRADFKQANLLGAELIQAILIGTDFTEANLTQAGLTGTQALATNFERAILTGACIEDWNVHRETNFNDVTCDYFYLKNQQQERRPSDRTKIFAPGDFAKLVQKGLETVDLIFSKGIDWKAFALSLEDLRVEYEGENLQIQEIENKYGAFIIRLSVSPDADKGAIERSHWEIYEPRLKAQEERLALQGEQLMFYREQVEIERKNNTNLQGIIKTMAEKENSKYDLRGSKFGGGFAAEGGMQLGGTFIDASSNPTLVEVAQEIQQIHDHLLQSQPSGTVDEFELAKQLKAAIEKRPTLKQRLVGAIKGGGAEFLKSWVNRVGFNILLESARGWMNPE